MAVVRVCPCIWCQVDFVRQRTMRLVRWRNTGLYWAPYGTSSNPVTGVKRGKAHLFGPQHLAKIGNKQLVAVKPSDAAIARVRASLP